MADEIKSIHLITRDGMVKKSTKKKRSAIMSLIADGSVQLSSVWRFSVWETMSPLISELQELFILLATQWLMARMKALSFFFLEPCDSRSRNTWVW